MLQLLAPNKISPTYSLYTFRYATIYGAKDSKTRYRGTCALSSLLLCMLELRWTGKSSYSKLTSAVCLVSQEQSLSSTGSLIKRSQKHNASKWSASQFRQCLPAFDFCFISGATQRRFDSVGYTSKMQQKLLAISFIPSLAFGNKGKQIDDLMNNLCCTDFQGVKAKSIAVVTIARQEAL